MNLLNEGLRLLSPKFPILLSKSESEIERVILSNKIEQIYEKN
jgi:hypothetical protein